MRCSHYADGLTRCPDPATVWILSPDGNRVPGSWLCQHHGERIQNEYAEKLQEYWALQPIDLLGNACRQIVASADTHAEGAP